MLIALSTATHLIAAMVFLCSIILGMVFHANSENHEGSTTSTNKVKWQKRFQLLQRVSIGLLIFTGLHLMLGDSNYTGWFSMKNLWSQLLWVKHALIVILILLLVVSSVIVVPLHRQSLLNEDHASYSAFLRWGDRFLKLQLLLAVLIIFISTSLVIQ